jgi:hypothetical protein
VRESKTPLLKQLCLAYKVFKVLNALIIDFFNFFSLQTLALLSIYRYIFM